MAETAVAEYLQQMGWPYAERRALSGANDKGDIAGVPSVCFEIKNAARLEIPKWLRETHNETVRAKASHGLLVMKPKGVGLSRVGDWWTVMPFRENLRLLKEAGY